MTKNIYREKQEVWVWDTGIREWFHGKTLHIWRTAEHEEGEAWEVELDNGARGTSAATYIVGQKPPSPPKEISATLAVFSKSAAQAMLDKCADDEPVFLLRGQDRYMVPTVKAWSDKVANGTDSDDSLILAARVDETLDEAIDWQLSHTTKEPD